MIDTINENSINIDGKVISATSPTYFIADIAANHDGDLSRAKDLICLAADAGADAAKFQHFTADTIVSDLGFKNLGKKISHQKVWKKSIYDVYKDASLSLDWTNELFQTCKKSGITFLTSPYSLALVDAVDPYVSAYKIGSGDITWLEIIEYIAKKNKPYILATGASSHKDVVRAVSAGLKYNRQLAVLQCNTNYTGKADNYKYVQLKVLNTYRELFPDLILGLSDHTEGYTSVLGAISLGAKIVEKHFTDNRNRIGPDHGFSMDHNSWKEMIEKSRELEQCLGFEEKKIEENELETVILQRRSIRLIKDIFRGGVIDRGAIEILRPCPVDAIQPYEIDNIVGKRVNKNMRQGDYIRWIDLE